MGAPLAGAVLAQSLGLGVAWGVGALWAGALLRLAVALGRPRVHLAWRTAQGADRAVVHDLRVLPAVAALRRHHPTLGAQGLDEVLATQWQAARTAPRPLRAWAAAFVAQLLLLPAWAALGLFTLAGCLWNGDPAAESLVVFGMGPPMSVLIWPASGLLGLLMLAPFGAWLARRG